MIKLVAVDGTPQWVNPAHVLTVIAKRSSEDVPIVGTCGVMFVNGVVLEVRGNVDTVATVLNGGVNG